MCVYVCVPRGERERETNTLTQMGGMGGTISGKLTREREKEKNATYANHIPDSSVGSREQPKNRKNRRVARIARRAKQTNW